MGETRVDLLRLLEDLKDAYPGSIEETILTEAVAAQLEEWGEGADASPRTRRRTRTLERDLRSVLADLSEEYPLLATLIERRPGSPGRRGAESPPATASRFASTPDPRTSGGARLAGR